MGTCGGLTAGLTGLFRGQAEGESPSPQAPRLRAFIGGAAARSLTRPRFVTSLILIGLGARESFKAEVGT